MARRVTALRSINNPQEYKIISRPAVPFCDKSVASCDQGVPSRFLNKMRFDGTLHLVQQLGACPVGLRTECSVRCDGVHTQRQSLFFGIFIDKFSLCE